LAEWLQNLRLNPTRGLKARATEAAVQRASKRFGQHVRAALQNLSRLLATPDAARRRGN
jgi:hypothetical protein